MAKARKAKATTILCIALALILVGSIGASILQTDGGDITIKELYILTDHQQVLHAQAFIPKDASVENKVPCVVAGHGWLNTLEMQDATCIELARRGIMVLAYDSYSHGLSSNVRFDVYGGIFSPLFWCEGEENYDGLGAIPAVNYVSSGILDFVDTDRIGISGHSMGAVNAIDTLKNFGALYESAIEAAKAPDSDGGIEITEEEQAAADANYKINSAFLMGYCPGRINDLGYWERIKANVGLVYGLYEEGGNGSSTGSGAILGDSYDALSFVNSSNPDVTFVEEGVYYGSAEDRTLRVLYQPAVTHPLEHFSTVSTRYEIEYFCDVFGVNTDLASSNQIWTFKEFCNLVAFVGLLMTLVPLTEILLSAPCFASLKASAEPERLPALNGERKKIFWIGWVVIGLASLLFAHITVKLCGKLFADWMNTQRPIWASYTYNIVGMWTAMCAVFSLVWFYIFYRKDKAAGIRNAENIGWKISGKGLLKSFALMITVVAIYYAIVWFCKWAFNTDFRFWTPAVKTFTPKYIIYFLVYLPIFFVFYLANSLIVNGSMRVDGMSEKKNLLICGFGNIIGCGLMGIIQYGKLFTSGTVLWGDWIMAYVIIWCFWQLFLAPYLERKFFKLTGSNWYGAMLISVVYVMMGVANTSLVGIA